MGLSHGDLAAHEWTPVPFSAFGKMSSKTTANPSGTAEPTEPEDQHEASRGRASRPLAQELFLWVKTQRVLVPIRTG